MSVEQRRGAHPLVGTWRLVSCVHTLSDKTTWEPLGPEPDGRLVYTPDGTMMVLLMAAGRPKAASGQVFEATDAERAAAAAGFLAYSGRAEIAEDRVVHHVDLSLFPNWVGTVQMRHYRLEGDTVTFWTRPFCIHGKDQTAALTWRREH